MDIDIHLDELFDPIKKIYKEVSLDDVFNVLGDPAQSLRVRDRSLWEENQRKRAISLLLMDLGKKREYYYSFIVLITYKTWL